MTDRPKAPWEERAAPPAAEPAPVETKAEKAEAAAIRRRWVTLGEVLAVLAVTISALTLWNSYSERSHSEADRQSAEQKAASAAATLVLKSTLSKDRETLALAPVDPRQTIQSQRILFPSAAKQAAIDTTGDARIEAGWIAWAKAGQPHGRDLRLPIAITTRFVSDGGGEPIETSALYHLGYRVEGRLLGSAVELTGLSLVQRVSTGVAQRRLDLLR